MQDLAKMIPLELVGPWRCIRTYRGLRFKNLLVDVWQIVNLNRVMLYVEYGEREAMFGV